MTPTKIGRQAARGESAQVRSLTRAHLGKRGTPAADAFLRSARDLLSHWALEGGQSLEGAELDAAFDAYLTEFSE